VRPDFVRLVVEGVEMRDDRLESDRRMFLMERGKVDCVTGDNVVGAAARRLIWDRRDVSERAAHIIRGIEQSSDDVANRSPDVADDFHHSFKYACHSTLP
jgi:hypothetical protein